MHEKTTVFFVFLFFFECRKQPRKTSIQKKQARAENKQKKQRQKTRAPKKNKCAEKHT